MKDTGLAEGDTGPTFYHPLASVEQAVRIGT